ncbi:MAG TPA: hypothetical protein VL285_03745 [Bryobacteraceae bacterium]|nr:hypothetical protein [Bryobacteraceae bacterium]
MGNLFAANSNGVLLTNVLVGTYVVTPDCAVTMTVGDPFSTTTTTPIGGVFGAPGVNLGSHTVNLEGVIVDSGNSSEIHLVVTNAGGAGATVTMVKTSQFSSCTNASIFGNYAVSGQGMVTSATATGTTTGGGLTGGGGVTTTGTTGTAGAFTSGVAGSLGTPFLLLGRTVADGAGNLVTDFSSTNATVKRAITGTYTVNADCTGTARLQDTSGVARNISFVLVNEAAACSNGLQTGARQSLQFVFTDPGVIGSGEARQQ